jgi:hypothetical protein
MRHQIGQLVQIGLLTLFCALFALNTEWGVTVGQGQRHRLERSEQVMLAGTPPYILAERFNRELFLTVPHLFHAAL